MSVRLTKLTTAMRVRSVRDASKDSSDTSSSYLQERGGCHRRSRNVWDEMDIRCADGHRSSLLSMSQRAPQINTAAVATPATSRERSAGSEACSQIISRKSRAASASKGGVERMERRMVATRMSCAHNRLGHGNPALEDI